MSALTITQAVSGIGTPKSYSKQYSASLPALLDGEPVPDSSTDLQINFTLDFSAVKAFVLVSDRDITIETNDGTTPDDTISLLAGVPYIWTEDSYDSFLITADITALFVTNASGETATIYIWGVVDPTP